MTPLASGCSKTCKSGIWHPRRSGRTWSTSRGSRGTSVGPRPCWARRRFRAYQVYLTTERHLAPSTLIIAVAALRFLPAYNGRPGPRALWNTPKGEIELELYPGDAPFGVEQFLRLVESGDIVGTGFTPLVPDLVAQQQSICNAMPLRDEVTRRGLTRGNLSWASAGLDTGLPGYTLGHTPQPHNEGNFTALGRVIRGMEVVDRLELGDRITAARMVR